MQAERRLTLQSHVGIDCVTSYDWSHGFLIGQLLHLLLRIANHSDAS